MSNQTSKFTKEQYDAYEESLKVYRDWQNTIATAEHKGIWQNTIATAEHKGIEKGRILGKEEGLKQGQTEEKKKIAKALKDMGMSIEDISRATGMGLDEIRLL